MKKHKAIGPFLVFAAIATLLWAAGSYAHLSLPEASNGYLISRWLAIAALIYYGFQRRSLTAWIIVGMVLGAEIGHGFAVAVDRAEKHLNRLLRAE